MTEDTAVRAHAIDILARTLWGEARGEGLDGMAAVADVVLNRFAVARADTQPYWWGATIVQICTKPFQFSCWNLNDPNRDKLLAVTAADPQFADALMLATAAADNKLRDRTHGATHYRAPGANPAWAEGLSPVASIGNHFFYRPPDVPAVSTLQA